MAAKLIDVASWIVGLAVLGNQCRRMQQELPPNEKHYPVIVFMGLFVFSMPLVFFSYYKHTDKEIEEARFIAKLGIFCLLISEAGFTVLELFYPEIRMVGHGASFVLGPATLIWTVTSVILCLVIDYRAKIAKEEEAEKSRKQV